VPRVPSSVNSTQSPLPRVTTATCLTQPAGKDSSTRVSDTSYFALTARFPIPSNSTFGYRAYVAVGRVDEIRRTFRRYALEEGVIKPSVAAAAVAAPASASNQLRKIIAVAAAATPAAAPAGHQGAAEFSSTASRLEAATESAGAAVAATVRSFVADAAAAVDQLLEHTPLAAAISHHDADADARPLRRLLFDEGESAASGSAAAGVAAGSRRLLV